MSRKRAPTPDDDGCMCVGSGNDAEVSVIRSADGKTSKVAISLSSTLNALKDAIGADSALGPIRRSEQRLFHLGRELKSGNRSLEALGIGRHNVFSIHLHSLAPKTVDLQSDDEGGSVGKREAGMGRVRRKGDGSVEEESDDEVIDLAGTGPSDSGGRRRHDNSMQQQREKREEVVELLDSDSDDEVIEIVEQTAPKRRRRE